MVCDHALNSSELGCAASQLGLSCGGIQCLSGYPQLLQLQALGEKAGVHHKPHCYA